jgi:hypothetical protein
MKKKSRSIKTFFKKTPVESPVHDSPPMRISANELKTVFEPVMTDIERLVNNQIVKAYGKEGRKPAVSFVSLPEGHARD